MMGSKILNRMVCDESLPFLRATGISRSSTGSTDLGDSHCIGGSVSGSFFSFFEELSCINPKCTSMMNTCTGTHKSG